MGKAEAEADRKQRWCLVVNYSTFVEAKKGAKGGCVLDQALLCSHLAAVRVFPPFPRGEDEVAFRGDVYPDLPFAPFSWYVECRTRPAAAAAAALITAVKMTLP